MRRDPVKQIGLNQVNEFIRGELKRKLREDLRYHRIRREGDIECCVYFHLRKLLNPDPDWRIFAHKHDSRTDTFPDLLIYRKYELTFPIEIKWNRKKISNHDRKKLKKYLISGASKGYFVTAGPDTDIYSKVNKEGIEKGHLFEVRTGLKFKGGKKSPKFVKWKKERGKFKV
jgi:hypothetical protein